MHFQFLIEDRSGEKLIECIMDKVISNSQNHTYDCKSFKGIGGFTKKNTIKETRTGKLLNDLATYMRGFQKSLQYIDAVLIIVLDNDDRDTKEFKRELESVAQKNSIIMDHVFCIAVEEVEAWLLGDEKAIESAYPGYKKNVLDSYVQDSICGTWEVLADVVYKGGMNQIRKKKMSFMEIGKLKAEWANNIVSFMDFEKNKSPSFSFFYDMISKRISPVV